MERINFDEMLDDFWCYPKLSKVKNLRDYKDGFFDFLNEQKPNNDVATNMYIHIPFCNSGCIFCPYYKLYGNKNYNKYIECYVDALISEINHYASTPYLKGKKISAVHFGGGNPFLLSISQLERIVEAIHQVFEVEVKDNWSIEGCINSIKNVEYVKGLLNLGINRLSIGVQTFKETIRKEMNIRASLEDVYKGIELLRQAGFDGYCIDMMYNLPDQSIEDFIYDLKKVTELEPYHIDLYNLDISPNTYLSNLIYKENKFQIKPSNENKKMLFEAGDKWLLDNGYKRLATNIYSQRQKELQIGDQYYLNNGNLIGVGVSSRGYIDGYSYKNVSELNEYLNLVEKKFFPANLAYKSTMEQMDDRRMVFFPVLMQIDKKDIPNLECYKEKIDHIIELDLACWKGNLLKVTEKGILWSGNIAALFIGKENLKPFFQSILYANRNEVNYYNEDNMGKEKVTWEEAEI